ncbi:MAG TPA: hypothetical protein VLT45_27800 [Kofleriaceae bacterium]|nr:hypothetical protein [Kofleriaceae bacterium]
MRLILLLALVACARRHEPQPREQPKVAPKQEAPKLSRADFNRFAVRKNVGLFETADGKIVPLLFYPSGGDAASVEAAAKETISDPRIALVAKDLDQGRPTLVQTTVAADEKPFVDHMLKVASLVDEIYDQQTGAAALASKLPADPESHSLFRRNHGVKCVAPATESDPQCTAIPGVTKQIVGLYPADLQAAPDFCKQLEGRPNAKDLLGPFTVVAGDKAVPYSEAYKPQMDAIATELEAAAGSVKGEAALVAYLRAAASSFRTNDWRPADEAWAAMTVDNSKWYVRAAPDEVYSDPCAHKAMFHLTFARIDQGSKKWQEKLVPVQQEMEAAVAAHAGAPYKARKVTFHLPDFIDIVINAGDDRSPLGATIGESLPNWGPVANEGRGRTVAMVNLYLDSDSIAARRQQAESVLDKASMAAYTGEQEPQLLTTILHEATHNLGPAHEYQVGGKTDEQVFGGPIAAVLEELKAQTGALFLLEFLRSKGIIDDKLAQAAYADAIVWAFGHISQGMYTGGKTRKTYGNVAAIQIGYLIDHGALTWDDNAAAANGTDRGAFAIHADKLVAACDAMMKDVAGIKARGDVKGAQALFDKYVDGPGVPQRVISERFLRFPKASFVYSMTP